MASQEPHAATPREKPQFGVRLDRGIVTYFNDEPITTYEQAEEVRRHLAEVMLEEGEVERVYVL